MTVQREYTCHCGELFWVFQDPVEEKIKHCPCCMQMGLKCTEREVK